MGEGIQRMGAMEELFGRDRLTEALRGKVREMIMALAEAELAEVLAAGSYERSEGRRGYRNGKRQRSISTGLGATVIELPRARISAGERDKEWRSGLIERYQRRASSVDRALSGLLFKRGERAKDQGGAFNASTWHAVIEERDLKVGGTSRSIVYPVAQPIVGE